MIYSLSAACGCHPGKVRTHNEDNFYFNGRCLPLENSGLPHVVTARYPLKTSLCFGVFDGLGGEQAGELASYTACRALQDQCACLPDQIIDPQDFLVGVCEKMNLAVCAGSETLPFGRMATTAALLLFMPDAVYTCNLGDSRIYRLRGSLLTQLSEDDVEVWPGMERKAKTPITQFLGAFPYELKPAPHISRHLLQPGDVYLICSDGLTDLMTDAELCACMKQHISVKQSAAHLLRQALANGGYDNITVVLCRVT